MAPDRKLAGPSAVVEAYPTGSVLLGELRDAANIPLTSGTARTSARVAAGATVDERSVLELCAALARAFLDTQLVPRASIDEPHGLLTCAIYSLIKTWDVATAPLRVGEPRPLDRCMMTMAGAQLFAVELGIRAGAWLALTPLTVDTSLPIPDRAAVMHRVVEAANLSQGALARVLGVAETTIVRWKKGSRPEERQLEALGTHLPPGIIEGVRGSLTITAIVEQLEGHLPDCLIADLWSGFLRICATSRAFHASRPSEASIATVVFGADANPELVDLLLASLPDDELHWRAPIDSAFDWAARLEFVQGVAWRAAITDLPDEVRIVFWKAFSEATPAVAQVADALARLHPELAAHCVATRELFEASVALRQRRRADAVRHLRQAHATLPDDPGVTRAVIDGLLRVGEPDEAILQTVNTAEGMAEARQIRAAKLLATDHVHAGLAELEAMLCEGDVHPEMYLYVGVARFRASDFAGALEALEQVISDQRFEHHALALDIAAACAFELGKNKRGEELARRANQVGVSRSYWSERIAKLRRNAV